MIVYRVLMSNLTAMAIPIKALGQPGTNYLITIFIQ